MMAAGPAALLLSGCATDSAKNTLEHPTIANTVTPPDQTFDHFSISQQMAACSLFLETPSARGIYLSPDSKTKSTTDTAKRDIEISSSPENDLKQAIELELGGHPAEARKLYLWLTAANPDSSFTMPCGNGVNLSSKIVRLAQQRLAMMDISNPELAKSDEIDEKVAMAKVAPGPALPNPPKVKRNTDFYLTAGPMDAMPEDNNPPAPPFAIEVSPNTETLARVTPPKEPVSLKSDKAVGIGNVTTVKPPKESPASEILELTGGVGAASVKSASLQPNSTPQEDGNLQSMPTAPRQENTRATPLPDDMVPGANDPKSARMATKPAPVETEMTTKPERHGPPVPSSAAPATVDRVPSVQAGQPYYALQLAAYRSREMAESSWLKLQKKSGGLLSGIDHEVRTYAEKDKGLYFRLMTGHFPDKSTAERVCQGFKANNLDCIIRYVKP
ncbi:SPOR domain-containing protein [Thalassospira sp. TSL5-1]|uniref:SPOR domain-containing protein n=1 Tax=Thalassospira sp. TSL5-1 TaxID=1544451 RepID=UPI00093998B8|nr:SPOR domain-containing protein [Thalassospira sp. TSL5-1]OKH89828.1 hypothetical protein LF95_07955 [Thalassospira sp. TSL5-1]